VALKAGVSQATASRALAGDPRISDPTRATVIEAAEALAFVPNQTARNLRKQSTQTLGLLLSDLADPDHAQVGAGFEQAAADAGFSVLVVAARKQVEDEERAVRALQERGTDGICVASSSLDPVQIRSSVAPTPLVVVQPDHPSLVTDGNPLPPGIIRSDDVAGVEQIVRHLLSCGYREMAYLGVGPSFTNEVRGSTAGRVMLTESGATMRRFEVDDEAWRVPTQVAQALGEDLPEAVICYDDKLAISLLDGLRSRGIRVPDELAVVGYDGIPFAAFSNPRLTTVRVPSAEMGALAADLLIASIESHVLPEAITVPVELVVRESSGARGECVP
jgi:LacI family transcriptional regulator, galactose operon repressor